MGSTTSIKLCFYLDACSVETNHGETSVHCAASMKFHGMPCQYARPFILTYCFVSSTLMFCDALLRESLPAILLTFVPFFFISDDMKSVKGSMRKYTLIRSVFA